MEKEYIRSLVYSIGGAKLPGEDGKAYLVRVSDCTGIGFSALRAAYYSQDTGDGRCIGSNGQPISDETINKLEQAAENARDAWLIIASVENQIARWEADPKKYRAFIDAAREFLRRLRGESDPAIPEVETSGMADFPAWLHAFSTGD